MNIDTLLASPSELTDSGGGKCPIVLMTRIRLARNLDRRSFPGWADSSQRDEILRQCMDTVVSVPSMKKNFAAATHELSELDKLMLVERHLISRELCGSKSGSGVVVNRGQTISVMINEEDHLRLQVLRTGFQLKKVWNQIDTLDNELESRLPYAFDSKLGYLTACPTNLGTAMRASAMMHLPALVIAGQMEKVVRAVNQLGMVVRGLFGEGSDASGSIFQISNQTTLGESEPDILKRLTSVLESIIEHEKNARDKLLETEANKLFDKIGRAFGILQNCHVLSSSEAMNLLSLLRLGVDLELMPESVRTSIDRLLIEAQPGHIQHSSENELDPSARDIVRAELVRKELGMFAKPDFTLQGNN